MTTTTELTSAWVPSITQGQRLRIARERLRLDRAQFAALIGRSRNTVSAYESDRSEPDWPTLFAWAALTNVHLAWLIDGTEPEPGQGVVEAALRARRDSNPQPSDLYPHLRLVTPEGKGASNPRAIRSPETKKAVTAQVLYLRGPRSGPGKAA